MKLSIISDMHLGFGTGSERESDSFEAASQAIEFSSDCDAILVAGDIFDTRTPNTETLIHAMQLFMKTNFWEGGAKVSEGIAKDLSDFSPLNLSGVPVIAIHGTHERRAKGLMNPVEGLEKAGFVIYLHCNGIILEKNKERVCVQAMSGVPDQYAESVLSQWNPKPVAGCYNIFMFHQSVAPFLYADKTIDVEKLPRGFDLYVAGHMHESQQSSHSDAPFIIPGSTIQTQLNKESVQRRGFWILDTQARELEFRELEGQRKVYYRAFENPSQEQIETEIEKILEEAHEKKPIIRIRLAGKEIDVSEIQNKFQNQAILSFKKDFEEEALPAKTIEEHRLSVQELGRKILHENLQAAGLDPERFESIFELLLEKKVDAAQEILYKS
ncbi:MAG: DNA repair exonuclease [Candidatus Aenigmarchaeota archaeon]|nr:DNA repair exonuclease [Candidatus Aenigmarchaeota archaeon]